MGELAHLNFEQICSQVVDPLGAFRLGQQLTILGWRVEHLRAQLDFPNHFFGIYCATFEFILRRRKSSRSFGRRGYGCVRGKRDRF